MWKRPFFLRVTGPAVVVSLVLFASCAAAAFYLYLQQASTAQTLSEDVESRRIAFEIETTLKNLAALVRDGSDQVGTLHERLLHLLAEAHDYADKEKETELLAKLGAALDRYHVQFESRLTAPDSERPAAIKAAVATLEKDAIPTVARLRNFNAAQIERSEQTFRQTFRRTAWGLLAVGTVGALSGIFLGYGMARALRRSMYRLSVRIRDAAGKLRQELPAVIVARGDDMEQLHEQMKGLVRQIEEVVERLQQREREVLRAEQLAAVGQLAAGVAHELRNPLTAVKMLVQASREDLQARGLPAEDLEVIEQEIRRLERSLQTFLDFARPPRTERRSVNLGSVVAEALALVGGRAKKQKVAAAFVPPEPPVWLDADAAQLRQLFVNLMMNSLDAMPQGGRLEAMLAVSGSRGAAGGGEVEVCILDTGTGIAQDLLPRLFQPFVSSKETGLGLGLVVSRRIAEAHGGTLDAARRAGGGACLTLRLPLPERLASGAA
jgi:signal transduction histidine kinase